MNRCNPLQEQFTVKSQVADLIMLVFALVYSTRPRKLRFPIAWKASALPLSYTRITGLTGCAAIAIAFVMRQSRKIEIFLNLRTASFKP